MWLVDSLFPSIISSHEVGAVIVPEDAVEGDDGGLICGGGIGRGEGWLGGKDGLSRLGGIVEAGDAEVLLEEGLELLDDGLLLGFALALGADDGHGREDAGDADAGGGDFALLETVVDELVGLGGLEVLFADDGVEVTLATLGHVALPVLDDVARRVGCHLVDELLDELLLVAKVGTRLDALDDLDDNLLVGAVALVVLVDEHEDVGDIDLHLLDELDLELDVVVDVLLLDAAATLAAHLVAEGEVPAGVLLHVEGRDELLVGRELVEGAEQIAHLEDGAEEADELLALLVVGDVGELADVEVGEQLADEFLIARVLPAVLVGVAFVVFLEGAHEHDAAGFLVTEDGEGLVGGVLEIAEANDVAAVLHGVEDAVGAAVGLQESVQLEVLIDPKGVQGLGIEAREEHSHHDEDVDLLVLHAKRHVLVVVLERLAVGGIAGAETLVVVVDGMVEGIAALEVELLGALGVLVVEVAHGVLFLVGGEGEDGGYGQRGCSRQGELLAELVVEEDGCLDAIDGEDGVEAACAADASLLLGLLPEVMDDVVGDDGDALGGVEGFLLVDGPDFLVVDTFLHLHGALVIDVELQDVLVADGVDDGVGVEGAGGLALLVGFATEDFGSGLDLADASRRT